MSISLEFVKKIEEIKPVFAKEVRKAYESQTELFEELANPMLEWAKSSLGADYQKTLIDGYCYFVVDVNRSQARYEITGKYEFSSYDEVYKETYDSPEFMSLYHWGVYTTTFAWLHHLELYQFYRDNFLNAFFTPEQKGRLVDLGSGSGIWHFIFLRHLKGWLSTAIDISETSVEAASAMSKIAAKDESTEYVVGDAMAYNEGEQFDAGVSCFLLEHLETPDQLLKNMSNNLKDGAYAFITGALTAAEVDHIFEFKRESEIILLAENAGFRVIKTYSSAPSGVSKSKKYLPRSMALILQKRQNEIW
ncbi:class I SAM-dependent methyltransferase [Neptuniibacter sp. QD37_6]|uniref:class I SAM-dependent methyltransferase n=1 Tax=Neptuniibacter sp. QD37_6 TaxID=3398210 RepID=UPI0039F4A0B5